MTPPEPKTHSLLSPSAAYRWMECPASAKINYLAAQSGQAPPPSPAALQGQHAHSLAEQWLVSGAGHQNPPVAVDEALRRSDDPDLRPALETYVSTVRSIAARGELLGIERRLTIPFLPPEHGQAQGGTVDALAYDAAARTLYVIDLKYGFVPVEVRRSDGSPNRQLGLYAAGALYETRHPVERVSMVIVQPRAHHWGGTVRWHEVSVSDLMAHVPEYRMAAEKAMTADLEDRVAGEWCRYCAVAGQCPAQLAMAQATVQSMIQDDMKVDVAPIRVMDNEALSWVLKNRKPIEQFLEAAETEALLRIGKGETVPGFAKGSVNTRMKFDTNHPFIKHVNKAGDWLRSNFANALKVQHPQDYEALAAGVRDIVPEYTDIESVDHFLNTLLKYALPAISELPVGMRNRLETIGVIIKPEGAAKIVPAQGAVNTRMKFDVNPPPNTVDHTIARYLQNQQSSKPKRNASPSTQATIYPPNLKK